MPIEVAGVLHNETTPENERVAICGSCGQVVIRYAADKGKDLGALADQHWDVCPGACPTCGAPKGQLRRHPDPQQAAAGRFCSDAYHRSVAEP